MSHPLFEPFDAGDLHLKNRVVMAPLTRKVMLLIIAKFGYLSPRLSQDFLGITG